MRAISGVTALVRSFFLVIAVIVAGALTQKTDAAFAQDKGGKAAPPAQQADPAKAKLEQLKSEAQTLMRAQKFAEAVGPAQEALRLAETIYGADTKETATAAHNFGFLLRRAGRDADAQGHLERALKVYLAQLQAVHEDTRNLLGELGQIYMKIGRAEDLARLYQDLISRAEREGFARHIGNAHTSNNLAFVLRGLKRYDAAEESWRRALSIYATQASPEDEPYRLAVDSLLDHHMGRSDFEKARAVVTETIARLAALGKGESNVAARWAIRLSNVELTAGRAVPARDHAMQALRLREALDIKGMELVEALNALARAERALANYSAAEAAYKRAIASLDPSINKANVGILTDNLAVLYNHMSRYAEAEEHHKRAMQLLETELGLKHRSVGQAAGNLGTLIYQAGRPREAEPFLLRALEIAEAQSPQDPFAIAVIVDNLSGVYRGTARHDKALESLRRALGLFEKIVPPDHPSLGIARNNYGRYLIDVGRPDDAVAQLERSLATAEKMEGKNHNSTAIVLTNLGEAHRVARRYSEARSALLRSIEILERVFGPQHQSLLVPLISLGQAELADNKIPQSAAVFERAISIELASLARSGSAGRSDGKSTVKGSDAFSGWLEANWRMGGTQRDIGRSIEIGQWETMTPAAVALAGLGARLGSGDAALARLVRERQDLAGEWAARDKRLTEILGQGANRSSDAEEVLRQRLTAIDARIAAIDRELSVAFPAFRELSRPRPSSIKDAQGLLRSNEAIVQFVTSDAATHAWVVTPSASRWQRLPIGERDLLTLVRNLRCGLDRAEWDGLGYDRCLKLLGLDAAKAPGPDDPLPFDVARAHGLYKILLGPFEDLIAGKDLLIVPTGPLTALPFQVLVTKEPAAPATVADFSGVHWLAAAHAVTVLPSISSLRALRTLARDSSARAPFIGFGNPLLAGSEGDDRRAWARQTCRLPDSTPRRLNVASAKTAAVTSLVRSGLVNVAELRRQIPLPETADELCAVARYVGADDSSVYLGARATEREIKVLSESGVLAQARVLHFATHGLLSGEAAQFLSSGAEPSLLLSPPDAATPEDDGLLTASEIAALKLDADWVVLSACNTAAGDQVGAESFSGLARAFFYAGARALLVSHWAVDSEATVRLVTKSFAELAADKSIGRAEAVRRSMLALIKDGGVQAHPAYWAPFAVAGEGGRAAGR
jgi:CHAT domain-containing protein/tetratricopeptide (TPR) repeat protein